MLGFSGLLLIGGRGNLGLCPAAYGTSYIRIKERWVCFWKKVTGAFQKEKDTYSKAK